MDITLLCIHSSLMNCFDKVIFHCFFNELKFHILSRDGKMLGLSPGIKVSILSKRGHCTFMLSTIVMFHYNGAQWYEQFVQLG